MNLSSEELVPELIAKTKNEPDEGGHLTVDVFQSADDIVVQSTVAGTDPNNIDISITKDMVTIRGRRDPEEKIKVTDYYHRELYWGPFSRSIILPADIDSDSAKASMKNGILTIRLPRIEKSVKKAK